MKYLTFFYGLLICYGCTNIKKVPNAADYNKVDTKVLIADKVSIRALLVQGNKIWYGADKGRFGYFDIDANTRKEATPIRDIEFRSIATNGSDIFIVNAGSPATLYRIKGLLPTKVYEETHEKVFYDSMRFWNAAEGIAIGDPTDSCLSILVTRDGGKSWSKIPCNNLPHIVEGEAAFAASNTNLIVKGNHTWVVSGGKQSRVFYSDDKGAHWSVYNTPVVQGGAMTGIFTADFYDKNIGFIAGGDYEKPNQNSGNKALTIDGGKTRKLVADGNGFGYASCIQFVPRSNGRGLVSVGATGLWYSHDQGKNWKRLHDDPSLYTIRFADENTAFAAGKDKLIQIEFKQ